MTFDKEILARIAELIGVDELRTYETTRDAIGFVLRVDDVDEAIEVGMSRMTPEVLPRLLLEVATQVRGIADQRRRAEIVAAAGFEFKPIGPLSTEYADWIDYKMKSTMSALGLTREQLGLREESKPLNRFSAIAEEMKEMK